MPDYSRKELSIYRLEKSEEDLQTAKHDFNAGHFFACINRTYYAIFHAIRAVLILDGVDFKKHSAVIGSFRKDYIKTGLFPESYSDIIGDASNLRGKSDYDDFYIATKEEAQEQIAHAEAFCESVKQHVEARIALGQVTEACDDQSADEQER